MSRERSSWVPVSKATVQLWAIEQRERERRPARTGRTPRRLAGAVLRSLGTLLRVPPGR